MGDELRNYWHPVARVASVGSSPVAAQLLGEQLVLFRVDDEIVVLQDLCIHRGTPLSIGWMDGDEIVCHYHGWRYDRTGGCTLIPSLPPGGRIPPAAKIPRFRCEERYGLVWVALDEPKHPIPDYPAYESESMTTVLYDDFRWEANAARVIENVLDYTHFPWVHDGLLGQRDHPVYPHVRPEIFDDGFHYDVPDDRNNTIRSYRLFLPFTVTLTVTTRIPEHERETDPMSPKGRNYSMMFTCCPVSNRDTIQWFFTSRDWNLTKPDEEWYAFDAVVMSQDQVVVESQRPEDLPLDLSAELHLRGTDAGALAYRRMLRDRGVAWHH